MKVVTHVLKGDPMTQQPDHRDAETRGIGSGPFPQMEQKLIENSEQYLILKPTGQPIKPIGISIAVTARCNSHCIMCSIWKLCRDNPELIKQDMPIKEILGYLKDPYLSDLVEIDLTGGEPHLREDLVELIFGIVAMKSSVLKKLKTIIVPSNGFLTDTILARTERILAGLKGTGIDFVSVTSLDGLGRTHDIIRATKGAFDKASKTIEGLAKLQKTYSAFFWPGIKTTITHYNVDELEAMMNFARKRDMFYIISSVIISKKRFRNDPYSNLLALGPDDLLKINAFYEKRKKDLDFYYEKIFDSITTGRKQWICTALFNYLFIDHDRKVYPCPIQDECVGDLTRATLTEILTSERAAEVRKKIGAYSLCKQCTEPGAVRYSQVMEGRTLLNFIRSKGTEHYEEIIVKKGLQKLLVS